MKRRLFISCALAGLLAGCGGGTKHPSTETTTAGTVKAPTDGSRVGSSALRQGVRSAIEMNAHLSSYVLWNNVVPSWAGRSTKGPALSGLRSSAADRRAHRLRVRSVSLGVAILSIKLDPSYLLATARVRESGSVTRYRRGRRVGHPIHLDEVARLELHRVAGTSRFVVWKVTLS